MTPPDPFPTLDEAIRSHVLAALTRTGGNKQQAAKLLGVSLKTVYNHLNRMESQGCPAPGCALPRPGSLPPGQPGARS